MPDWWQAAVIAVGGSIALFAAVLAGIVAWHRRRGRARRRSVARRLMPSQDSQ